MISSGRVLGLVLTGVMLFGGGIKVGMDHVEASQAREDKLIQKVSDASTKAAAKAIAGIKVNNTTIQQNLRREIDEKPVYTDCRHSPDGLRAVNAALEPPGGSQLPGIDASAR